MSSLFKRPSKDNPQDRSIKSTSRILSCGVCNFFLCLEDLKRPSNERWPIFKEWEIFKEFSMTEKRLKDLLWIEYLQCAFYGYILIQEHQKSFQITFRSKKKTLRDLLTIYKPYMVFYNQKSNIMSSKTRKSFKRYYKIGLPKMLQRSSMVKRLSNAFYSWEVFYGLNTFKRTSKDKRPLKGLLWLNDI